MNTEAQGHLLPDTEHCAIDLRPRHAFWEDTGGTKNPIMAGSSYALLFYFPKTEVDRMIEESFSNKGEELQD